ncbi:class I SAM-dependent methyltransferase [Companilactobacillus bobalius]|uniref:Site-specific DNA-methyltransferase (Adenine-specific) n=2 Tax=Companilactobacillus bobalius TaxID=2801451 RepID=A0A202F808_9LACO|nr:class I SAM-dependent methyltransferase [Companilactobacillus bobalius]GEO58428.1 lactate dehydrogenase [Companilactobacillus paralimentarius]KAE9557619.1 DNA methyltransferase [Companilactobacillus bobalius]KAE9563765.1 DNA methyltransferase [Companilactobacillus bobalius]KRK83512.1 adenine-specific DNA methyltransferase [Companilactobacillus bobalius DSM 19674]OVE96595.1 Site-specific DNA-methyltransferase (adenine-specific) [Companilactobacillus bobalius]
MSEKDMQTYFDKMNQANSLLKESLRVNNIESLAETLTDISDGSVYVENGVPDKDTVSKLENIYAEMKKLNLTPLQLKQAITVSIIKAQKDDKAEVNKLMTPDAIGLITSLIAYEVLNVQNKKDVNIVDPTVGTGNLLIEVIEQLNMTDKFNINAAALDNDDALVSLTKSFSEVMNLNLDAYHQDSVADWDITDIDLAVADLPVGYYPIDDNAKNFKTKSDKGHSYAHHLLIEQTMNNLNDGGIGIFIVPSQIFQTDQAKKLSEWMVSSVYLQAVLDLPTSLFASKEAQKAVVVLQKHGDNAKQVENVLMGTIPDTNNPKLFEGFKDQLQSWAKNFKG